MIDELERMQVFYVNIGGGEPTVRPRLLGAGRLRHRPPGRREVLHQRHPDHARGRGPPARRQRLRRRADLPRRRHRRGQRRGARRRARTPPPCGRWTTSPPPASAASSSPSSAPGRTSPQLDEFKAHRRPLRRPAAADPAAPVRSRGRRLGRAAPDRGPAARAVRLAGGARRGRPDRRLVLPPGRLRRAAAGPQPVRRRPGGLPDRPGRRRLRLPVRHPRRVPGRQRALRRAGSPRVWRESELFRELREPQSGGACRSCARVRRLPGRLHGGEVLHRAAARRPRPRVRAGPRRHRTGPRGRCRAAAER